MHDVTNPFMVTGTLTIYGAFRLIFPGLAAGGFRSVSALIEADPSMWADVAATNTDNIVRQLDQLIAKLQSYREMISAHDEALNAELAQARATHHAWLERRGEVTPQQTPSAEKGPQPRSGWFRRG